MSPELDKDWYCVDCKIYHNCLGKCLIMDNLLLEWSKKKEFTPAIAEGCVKQIKGILEPKTKK